MARWVMTDLHGKANAFKRMVEKRICLDLEEDTLFLLGDYVDRGEESMELVDYIFELKAKGYKVVALRGNHEQMLLDSLKDEKAAGRWFYNGGNNTLESFGVSRAEDIPQKYLDFFENLEYYVELDDYVLVHAGLNFKKRNPFRDKISMLWTRDFEVNPKKIRNKVLVHGHTPMELSAIEYMVNDSETHRIALDNACFYTEEGYGHMCALELDSRKLIFEKVS